MDCTAQFVTYRLNNNFYDIEINKKTTNDVWFVVLTVILHSVMIIAIRNAGLITFRTQPDYNFILSIHPFSLNRLS